MNRYDSLPEAVTDLFGDEAAAERAYDLLTVDVPVTDWLDALRTARDELGCTYFDWLSAVDEPGTGFRVCAHVAAVGDGAPRRLLLRTTVPHTAPALPTAIGVYAGAAWHERETHEMFGVVFEGHPNLTPLLLPENFEGHPLRKDFVLAARVAKAWPGAKEPGESHDGGPKRRQVLPPGVPDPNEWGPLKGQLPPAPERPARAAAGDRPRRTRTAADGSAGQETPPRRTRTASDGSTPQPPEAPPAAAPRRTRTASDGSASQTPPATPEAAPDATQMSPATPEASPAAPAPAPRRTRSASDGSASQTPPAAPRRTRSASQGSASQQAEQPGEPPTAPAPPPCTRSADAPWHHARPAFDDTSKPTTPTPEPPPEAKPAGDEPTSEAKPAAAEPEPESGPQPATAEPAPEAKPAAGDRGSGTSPAGPGPGPGSGTHPDTHPDPDPAGGDPA
ncbi:NADH-quinone oxidoreductase subunit C [Streptomyces sp. NPDC004779]